MASDPARRLMAYSTSTTEYMQSNWHEVVPEPHTCSDTMKSSSEGRRCHRSRSVCVVVAGQAIESRRPPRHGRRTFRLRSTALGGRAIYRWALSSSDSQEAPTEQSQGGQSMQVRASSCRLPLPPIDEQRRIADFLDDQVTRIDQIIDARVSRSSSLRELCAADSATCDRRAGRPGRDRRAAGGWLGRSPQTVDVRRIGSIACPRRSDRGAGLERWDYPCVEVSDLLPLAATGR